MIEYGGPQARYGCEDNLNITRRRRRKGNGRRSQVNAVFVSCPANTKGSYCPPAPPAGQKGGKALSAGTALHHRSARSVLGALRDHHEARAYSPRPSAAPSTR